MSYTEDIVELIEKQLVRLVSLPTFQLITHVPNLEFWMREVFHANLVLNGYQERFDKMLQVANQESIRFPKENIVREGHDYDYKPLSPAITMERLDGLKRRLASVTKTLLERLARESLISIEMFDELLQLATEGAPFESSRDPTRRQ